MAMILKLALITGQHVGEVAVMTKAELDLSYASPTWTQAAARRKNKGVSRIPLSPLTVKLIIEALARSGDSAYLFPPAMGNAPITAHAATRAISRTGALRFCGASSCPPPEDRDVDMATVA
jgi:integrase